MHNFAFIWHQFYIYRDMEIIAVTRMCSLTIKWNIINMRGGCICSDICWYVLQSLQTKMFAMLLLQYMLRLSISINMTWLFIFSNMYLLSRRFLDRHFNIWRIWFVSHPTRQRRVIDSNYILKMLKCLSKNLLDNKWFIFFLLICFLFIYYLY